MIGDGSFQLTAQEISTMVRYGTKPIIVLLNNRGYTIEAEIHDGPYNRIKNWDYAGLMAWSTPVRAKDLDCTPRPSASWTSRWTVR